jgi:Protein of unknown function (DUF2630)
MKDEAADQPVLNHIKELAAGEHRLYSHETLSDADRTRLAKINIELDQCWDLLRQRQALRDAGRSPNDAHVRPAEIVENYEQRCQRSRLERSSLITRRSRNDKDMYRRVAVPAYQWRISRSSIANDVV